MDPNILYIFCQIFFLAGLLIFPSCVRERRYSCSVVNLQNRKIFIEMPKNAMVFENIAPLVYEALWNHFDRVGFDVVDKPHNSFILSVSIENIEPAYKFISTDLLTYAFRVGMKVSCKLYDKNKNVLAQKLFYFSTIVSKPKRSVLLSSFLDFEYKRLLERNVSQIDYYFRPFIVDWCSHEK